MPSDDHRVRAAEPRLPPAGPGPPGPGMRRAGRRATRAASTSRIIVNFGLCLKAKLSYCLSLKRDEARRVAIVFTQKLKISTTIRRRSTRRLDSVKLSHRPRRRLFVRVGRGRRLSRAPSELGGRRAPGAQGDKRYSELKSALMTSSPQRFSG